MKAKDIMNLADEGYVSISLLSERLGLTEEVACRALKACWDKGLLMPVDRAYFARPIEGLPAKFVNSRVARSRDNLRTTLMRVKQYVVDQPDLGFTLRDLAAVSGIEAQKLRNMLKQLVAEGHLISRQAIKGGMYKAPYIWGVTDEAIDAREDQVLADFKQRNKPGPKPKKETPEPKFINQFQPPPKERKRKLRGDDDPFTIV